MISETAFAQHHSSIWRELIPTSELFVRRINSELYEREFAPLHSSIDPGRRGFINEIAFNLFCNWVAQGMSSWKSEPPISEIASCTDLARTQISKMERLLPEAIADPSSSETHDCLFQFYRFQCFFKQQAQGAPIAVRPHFPGCGIIDTCNGDVYFSGCLFEIKAGDRGYRSVDLRQLLIYAALNSESHTYPLCSLALFNPRTGTSFKCPLDALCFEVSGKSSAELLADIVRAISSGDISR